MKKNKSFMFSSNMTIIIFLWLGITNNIYSIGLRSFVALPVEKKGAVIRLAFEHENNSNINNLTTSVAYGLSADQTLLLGLPYRISPAEKYRQGDISVLYRHIKWQQDSESGTNRLGLLGGVILPTAEGKDMAFQAGFVFTHIKNRHEIDMDALYLLGIDNRGDSGRYDISWQYRMLPFEYPEWGISQALNSVLELNGRWSEDNNITHQLTIGLQWIHQKLVVEGSVVKAINNTQEIRYMLSTRFHF